MKKILYIERTNLNIYPPCVSQIRMLNKLNIDFEVLYGTCDKKVLNIFEKEGIKYKKIGEIPENRNSKLKKILGLLNYRKSLKKMLKTYDLKNTILWFGNAESVIPMIGLLKKKEYIVSLLELHDGERSNIRIKMLKKIMPFAICSTACEETRAYIMQSMYNLQKLPYVFPNKSFEQITIRRFSPTIEETTKIINKIKKDNVIIYQGILQETDKIVEFAKALNMTNKKYKFLLMGDAKNIRLEEIKKYYSNIEFIPYISAPFHLEITSYARIGIAFYEPYCLNFAFCAPNKIYEYTGFGIPMICNDIPGLENTIGKYNAGKCIELKAESIAKAINEIDDNYEKFSDNAKKFYASCDNLKTMKKMLSDLNVIDEDLRNDK